MMGSGILFSLARKIYPKNEWKELFKRVIFFVFCFFEWTVLRKFFSRNTPEKLKTAIKERPEILGVVVWPYINNAWNANQRLRILLAHYIEACNFSWLAIDVNENKKICDLPVVLPGCHLIVDRPIWFLREGELCINIFIEDVRVYTLAFSFGRRDGQLCAYIGGIQGRNISNAQEVYQNLTKAAHGCRPRDLLVTVFFMMCESFKVEQILGISDANRHHKHPYFGQTQGDTLTSDYDSIWEDRAGVRMGDGFYSLPPRVKLKSMEDIPSKKRALYRRRYELFEKIRADISAISKSTP